MDPHGSHALIETAAAAVLSVGGSVALVRAALDRRRRLAGVGPASTPAPTPAPRIDALRALRAGEGRLLAALALAAGAIHLAAAPAHVAELGDLGLGFYWAALLQVGLAIALLRGPVPRARTWLGGTAIAVSLAITAAWLLSRTAGLPGAAGPEPPGLADAIATGFQLLLVALVVARTLRLDTRWVLARPRTPFRSLAAAGLVTTLGVVALSATIALADAAGHGHGSNVHATDGHGTSPTP